MEALGSEGDRARVHHRTEDGEPARVEVGGHTSPIPSDLLMVHPKERFVFSMSLRHDEAVLSRPALLGAAACAVLPVPPPLALGLGAAVALAGHGRDASRLTPKLLAATVVALGANVNLVEVADAGARGALLTVATITLCLVAGVLLARALGVEKRVALLIAVGTAICGGSAIAAVAPVVRAKDEETSTALGAVFVLNALALLLLPMLGRALHLDASTFGTYAALAVHDTSSVVGAAMSFGERAVEVATTVKLARATWIVPVTLLASTWITEDRETRREHPYFILGFLACAALFTFLPALEPLRAPLGFVTKRAMVVALFLVGTGFSKEALVRAGARPFLFAAALWILVAIFSLALVLA
jgi:uncharacterized integral membrane protein (TIGR00698 family)